MSDTFFTLIPSPFFTTTAVDSSATWEEPMSTEDSSLATMKHKDREEEDLLRDYERRGSAATFMCVVA